MNVTDRQGPRRLVLRALVGLAVLAALPWEALANVFTPPTFELVALTGEPGPVGGDFNLLERPQINEAGQVAFVGRVFDGVNDQQNGIFVGTPGSLETLALQRLPAPDGGNYLSFNQVVLNDAGQVAFRCLLNGGVSDYGIFVGTPSSVQTIAVNGMLSPDGAPFGRLRDFAFNDAGEIAFSSYLYGIPEDRLFGGTPGNLFTIAATGQLPADGGEPFVTFLPPMLNNSGQVAFRSGLDPTESRTALFVGAPGDIRTVAVQGGAAPGGGTIGVLVERDFNDNGQVAFFASMENAPNERGYFVATADAVTPVALHGDPAPGGGSYFVFGNNLINITDSGAVGFNTNISGATHTTAPFFGLPGEIGPVVVGGQPAPGGGVFLSPASPMSNAAGVVVFISNLTGPGIAPGNDHGLYASVGGAIIKLIREGDRIAVTAPDEFRTVANGGIDFSPLRSTNNGLGHGMSDSGYLALRLTFTDFSTAIYRVRLGQVPEPSSALLAIFAGAAMVHRRSRRTCE